MSRRQQHVGDTRRETDSGEFAAFVRDTGARLYRTAYLLTGDHHLAEDLTQSTYAKVFASWGRVRRTGNPVGYTRTMLLNTFLSHRRLRRNTEVPTDDLAPELATSATGAVGSDDWARRRDLVTAMSRLSATDRAVLVARYWEDRSVAETAADLGISDAAVRTRSRRALQRLRPHLVELSPERTQT